MSTLWAAACGGWVVGMLQGALIAYLVLTHQRRKGGVAVLRDKVNNAREWLTVHAITVALIIVILSNGLGWFVILQQNSANDRQDNALNSIAVCTRAYLTLDAEARDARSDAVKPRDEAEARFIKAVASLRNSDGSDPEGDAKKVAALFDATDEFEKAKAQLDKVRAVDYPTYTCDKSR
jgi:uncharacterized iron-regulated membrane protein